MGGVKEHPQKITSLGVGSSELGDQRPKKYHGGRAKNKSKHIFAVFELPLVKRMAGLPAGKMNLNHVSYTRHQQQKVRVPR
jgi:hypothetical protein